MKRVDDDVLADGPQPALGLGLFEQQIDVITLAAARAEHEVRALQVVEGLRQLHGNSRGLDFRVTIVIINVEYDDVPLRAMKIAEHIGAKRGFRIGPRDMPGNIDIGQRARDFAVAIFAALRIEEANGMRIRRKQVCKLVNGVVTLTASRRRKSQ